MDTSTSPFIFVVVYLVSFLKLISLHRPPSSSACLFLEQKRISLKPANTKHTNTPPSTRNNNLSPNDFLHNSRFLLHKDLFFFEVSLKKKSFESKKKFKGKFGRKENFVFYLFSHCFQYDVIVFALNGTIIIELKKKSLHFEMKI